MVQMKRTYIYAGFIWCFLFALISFYWAGGGMLGAKTLGGFIYKKAMEREPSFITLVWLLDSLSYAEGFFYFYF